MSYNPRLRAHMRQVCPYSEANATQRAGRAGRTAPGKCYRLYTHADFERLEDAPRPQTSVSEMGSTILNLMALEVKSVWELSFLDPPATESMYVLMKYSAV